MYPINFFINETLLEQRRDGSFIFRPELGKDDFEKTANFLKIYHMAKCEDGNWEDPADWELEYETIIEEAKEHHGACPRRAVFGDISAQVKFLTDVLSIYNLIKLHSIPEIKNQNDDSIQKILELPKANRYLSTQKTKTLFNMIKGIKSLARLVDRLSDQTGPNSQSSTVDNNSSSNELAFINSRKPPNSPRNQSPNRPVALISPVSDTIKHVATVRVNSPRRRSSQGQSSNFMTTGNQRIQNLSNPSQVQQSQSSISNNSSNNLNLSEPGIVQNTSFPGNISLIRGPHRQMPLQSQNIPNHSTPYHQRQPYTVRQISHPVHNPPTNQPLNTSIPVRYVIRQVDQMQGRNQFISGIPRRNIQNGQINNPSQYNQLFGSSFSSSQASTPSPAANHMTNQSRPRMTVPQYQTNPYQNSHQNNSQQVQKRVFQPRVPQRAIRPTMNNYLNNNMPIEVRRNSLEAEKQVFETRKKWRDDETRPLVEFSGVFDKSEDIEYEALKRSTIGPIKTGSKDKMLNGDVFIAKMNLDGQEHRLFFENYLVKDNQTRNGIVHSIMMLDEVPEKYKFYEPQAISWREEFGEFAHAWI